MTYTTRTAELQGEVYTKAGALIEALPWLTKYAGATLVVKYGGNAMVSEELKRAFVEDIVFLRRCGIRPATRSRPRRTDPRCRVTAHFRRRHLSMARATGQG